MQLFKSLAEKIMHYWNWCKHWLIITTQRFVHCLCQES